MASQLRFLVSLLFLWRLVCWPTSTSLDSHPLAKPGCQHSCGNINVPYPFGIGLEHCSVNAHFHLTCNDSFNPPRLFFGSVQVLDVSLDGEMSVNMFISYQCFDSRGRMGEPFLGFMRLIADSSFTFSSTRNRFTAIGCDTFGSFTGSWGKDFRAGCVSYCTDDKSVTNGSCDGIGCCQTAIPKGVRSVVMNLSSFDNYTQFSGTNFTCSYAFLADVKEFNFRAADVLGTEFWYRTKGAMPVVLDWALGSEEDRCENPKANSDVCVGGQCLNSPDGTGYRCTCQAGYTGNPYLPHGCIDIDECKIGTHDCDNEVSHCENRPGTYQCICREGYTGDGKIEGGRSNCTLIGVGSGRDQDVIKITTATGLSCLFLFIAISWTYWVYNKRKLIRLRQEFFKQNGGSLLSQLSSASHSGMDIIKIFTAEELEKATKNYHASNIVGKGGYGTVYKGKLLDNRVVAIKKAIIVDGSQVDQFINEVALLYRMNHRNVVQLLGCCLETQAPLLVYEFVPNGNLFDLIHHRAGHELLLSFDNRLKIAAESAGALAFLHSAAAVPIVHRDVKSANILLDINFTAKVSDFGASRLVPLDEVQVTTLVQGTLGYLDPEYFHTGQLSEKSDVYSFGVVLVELLTGALPICSTRSEDKRSLSTYFNAAMKENMLFQILDDQVMNGDVDQLVAVAELARRCLKVKGEDRPTMKEVAVELDRLIAMKQHPWLPKIHQEETQSMLGKDARSSHDFMDDSNDEQSMLQGMSQSFGDSSGQYGVSH